MWNDILTIVISILSLTIDTFMIITMLYLYRKNKDRNTRNTKVLKLIKGCVKENELLEHCNNLTQQEIKILKSYFCDNKTLETIAYDMNMSVESIKKSKNIAISKID